MQSLQCQGGRDGCVLLEGDQDTYNRLQVIKTEYGNDLSWMIPIPGDWHSLTNYQEVLLWVYFDAGLSDLAKASGYKPNSIGSSFIITFYLKPGNHCIGISCHYFYHKKLLLVFWTLSPNGSNPFLHLRINREV